MTDIGYLWQLRQLPRERMPARDLWAGIAAAIAQAPQSPPQPVRRRELRAAASACVAACVLGAFGLTLSNARLQEKLGLRHATPEHRLVLSEAHAIRQQYQSELRQFDDKHVPESITPALIELDQSADRIMVALDGHPDAVFLLDQLRRTYARRLELTQRMVML